MSRDYSAEFSTALAAYLPEGAYVSTVVAVKFRDHLLKTDPDLLKGWLVMAAPVFICDRIGIMQRHARAAAVGQRGPREFGAAADALAEDGDVDLFTTKFCLGAQTWKELGEMTGADHKYVAQEYDARANSNAMLAAFHKAIARKVGKRTTAEVLTETDYLTLRDSILKPARAAVA